MTSSSSPPPITVRTLEVLWHGCERDEEAVRRGLQGVAIEGIVSIDYCSRGHRIVTCGGDGHIRLWRLHPTATDAWLTNGQCDMTACVSYITGMRTAWTPLTARWSPHGGMIASAHCDGKICLWWQERGSGSGGKPNNNNNDDHSDAEDDMDDTAVWKDYRHLSGHVMDVYDICFSPDARYLLSAGGDGSIVIHDLGGNNTPNSNINNNSNSNNNNNGSTVPVVQLPEVHRSFCRGVAWDPWRRGVASFGGAPPLLFFTHVQSTNVRRTHLAAQRRAAGDYIGDSCATTFRRFGWSPDGSIVAVPYGKATPHHTHSNTNNNNNNNNNNINNNSNSNNNSTNKQKHTNDPNHHSSMGSSNGIRAGNDITTDATNGNGNSTSEARKADDMIHCVYLYTRNAPEKVAGRLIVRGYSEIRGVLWAPCFLEPLEDKKKDYHNTNEEEKEKEKDNDDITKRQENSLRERGSWGPDDYRMAMAVWTADAVVIYTTDSAVRHSDYTDLHMRSISDVAWSPHAKYLLTASLDGYVSVISTGKSLGIAHKLPTFSNKPVTVALSRMLLAIRQIGEKVELARRMPSYAESTGAKSVGGSTGTAAVVVHAPVKKKKKVEVAQPKEEKEQVKQPTEVVQLSELSDLMEGI
ncbi:WD40 repeat [Trypanosoma melophagium]|uniref:WD40 repeat n=1 Tax=Trypanosoma melophagium TaxID=715481 RepID=UPI003519F63A|nr:WD40 repeat [Trypanosoma melophagium]